MQHERRKPVAGTTGLLKIEKLAGKFDNQEDTPNPLHLQAQLIRDRFALSWPMARVVAELHFGRVA